MYVICNSIFSLMWVGTVWGNEAGQCKHTWLAGLLVDAETSCHAHGITTLCGCLACFDIQSGWACITLSHSRGWALYHVHGHLQQNQGKGAGGCLQGSESSPLILNQTLLHVDQIVVQYHLIVTCFHYIKLRITNVDILATIGLDWGQVLSPWRQNHDPNVNVYES